MPYEPARYIFHLKLGGGDRHRLAICTLAITAARHGDRIEDQTKWTAQKGDEIPDLVIFREESFKDGARVVKRVFRYRCEVIDTHDPVPDFKPGGGYDDCVKVFLKKGDEYCEGGHCADAPTEPLRHPLCWVGLFHICERALP